MIKNMYKRLFIITVMFFIMSLSFLQCEVIEEKFSVSGEILEYHIVRSNTGLSVWQIGLSGDNFAVLRNTDTGYQHNPVNWLIATNDSCVGEGIPDDLKLNCPFKGSSVIGLCAIRYYTSGVGFIIDTTAMIYSGFQEDEGEDEEERQSIYTHEIGHCLGLRHTSEWLPRGDTDYVMYPSTLASNVPHSYELNAIKSVYFANPTVPPNGSEGGRDYFQYFIRNTVTGNPVRHEHLPIFHIYPYDPLSVSFVFSQFSASEKIKDKVKKNVGKKVEIKTRRPERGKKLEKKPKRVIFYYYRNGDVKEEYIDEEGDIEDSIYIESSTNNKNYH